MDPSTDRSESHEGTEEGLESRVQQVEHSKKGKEERKSGSWGMTVAPR